MKQHRTYRSRPALTMAVAALLLPVAIGLVLTQRSQTLHAVDQSLKVEASHETQALSAYFDRARSIGLLTAQNPAFAEFYDAPRRADARGHAPVRAEINDALAYLEALYPGAIGEAAFIDRSGLENARVVNGEAAEADALSQDETENPFFDPTFALAPGHVYQAKPYLSPDTNEWVISNSTVVPTDDSINHAMVHFEVTIESFRREATHTGGDWIRVFVVNADDGSIVIDSDRPQVAGAPLPGVSEKRFRPSDFGESHGTLGLDGHRASYGVVPRTQSNANHWIVIAQNRAPNTPLSGINIPSRVLVLACMIFLAVSLINLRSSHRVLEEAVLTDALTALGNRRKLMEDLRRTLESSELQEPILLAIFDLNGFKDYNDRFGHLAGDALLTRLGKRLTDAVEPAGAAYRMGGDEFCIVVGADHDDHESILAAAVNALSERGEGFVISASHGSVALPAEATEPEAALRLADLRMYANKQGGRASAGRQSKDVLLSALQERDPALHEHLAEVGKLAERLGGRLGVVGEDLDHLREAAELHDIGKMAIPDEILSKPYSLDSQEWAFMKKHPLIGERIVAAAPSLAKVARLVRWSHERFDGGGYPDGLTADRIPLSARIIAVCDAFDGMTSDRAYRPRLSTKEAIAELRAGAGTQFDPDVVEALDKILAEDLVLVGAGVAPTRSI